MLMMLMPARLATRPLPVQMLLTMTYSPTAKLAVFCRRRRSQLSIKRVTTTQVVPPTMITIMNAIRGGDM